MFDRPYAVYMLASQKRGTLYIGVCRDLPRRIWQHRSKTIPGFTKRYGVPRLVWCELHQDITAAIQRKKSLMRWYRDWKIALVEKSNPEWQDLYGELFG
jgi:putative endonuclease